MPELSRFMGIVIKLLFKDDSQHNKPHIHMFITENMKPQSGSTANCLQVLFR